MLKSQFRIKKILNNNAVIADDFTNHEVIAIGNGLGYHHNVFDTIDQNEIIKIFHSKDDNLHSKIINALDEIPFDCIELTERIVSLAEKELSISLSETIIITLADHINFSIKRYNEGMILPNMINEEMKRFYKNEYKVGLTAVNIINEHYKIVLSKEEASSIAFHIIVAMDGRNEKEAIYVLNAVDRIIKIIEEVFESKLDEESLDYSRFIIHLKFFMKKVLGKAASEQQNKNKVLYEQLLAENDRLGVAINEINKFVEEKFNYHPDWDDRLYLMIHMLRLFNS